MAGLLLWPGALAIGLSLGLLGSGGSILTVPVLIYLLGQDERVAIAGSLAIVGLIATVGVLRQLRSGLIDWRSVIYFGGPGMLGTTVGAQASVVVTPSVQLGAFALVMALAAWQMLRPRTYVPPAAARPFWRIASDGLAVGAVTGFVGVGGGFLIVPALVVLGGLAMHRAVATSLAIIALKSLIGFVTYQHLLTQAGLLIDWQIILSVALVGILGSLFGVQLAGRLPRVTLERVFAWSLVVLSGAILVSALSG